MRWRSYAQEVPGTGDFAAEPPVLPPQAGMTPLDLPMSAAADLWPNVRPPPAPPMLPSHYIPQDCLPGVLILLDPSWDLTC